MNLKPMEVNSMLCPECCEEEMRVVDATGEGDPCWECPMCHYVTDYERGEEGPVWDGKDDAKLLKIEA